FMGSRRQLFQGVRCPDRRQRTRAGRELLQHKRHGRAARARATHRAAGSAGLRLWRSGHTDIRVVNGQTVLINDSRVPDNLRFTVPLDLPPGNYEFNVKVPNITGIPSLGTFLTSNIEYLRVNVPSAARFKIVSEKLHCKDETSPAWFGSDEIGITFLTTGLF